MIISLIGFIYNDNVASKTGNIKWNIAAPMFIGAIGMSVGTFVSSPLLSFVFTCITAVGVYVGMGVWWSVPTSFLSGPAATGATGLINSIGNLGGWVGPYLVGFIKTSTGSYKGAYLYLSFSLLVAGIFMLTLKKEVPFDVSIQQSTKNL